MRRRSRSPAAGRQKICDLRVMPLTSTLIDSRSHSMLLMRNIESKFRCSGHDGVRVRAMAGGATDQGIVDQRDVFFRVPQGRLKLRHVNGHGQLIAYVRDNVAEARPSEYRIFTTGEPQALEEVLGSALTLVETVQKRRHVLIHHHTRIHLDEVTGLGRFVELETVVGEIEDEDARREHGELVRLLELEACERVAIGYVDLLTRLQPPRVED